MSPFKDGYQFCPEVAGFNNAEKIYLWICLGEIKLLKDEHHSIQYTGV